MSRLLAAALCLFTAFPQPAWSALSQLPSGHANPVGQVALPALPVLPQTAVGAQSSAPQETPVAPAASLSLTGAAQIGVEVSAQQAAPTEGDAAKLDFANPTARPSETAVDAAVPAAEKRATLSPAAPSSDSSAKRPKVPLPSGVRTYLTGVFSAQVANAALIVTLPLALIHLGQSAGTAALMTALTTVFDIGGTAVGGWLIQKFPAPAVLKAATAARGLSLFGVAAALAGGWATIPLVLGLYTVDALGRGVADTARSVVPMSLVGKDKPALDSLNSTYQTVFEAGSVAGFLAVTLLQDHAELANWAIGPLFGAAALAFALMPSRPVAPTTGGPADGQSRAGALKKAWADPVLRTALSTVVLLSQMPALRAVLPVLFAVGILGAPALAAPLALAFGLGAVAGSLVYNRLHGRFAHPAWLLAGAAGAALLATAWLPGTFWPMAAGIFAFSLTNAGAKLAATSALQARIPDGAEGAVMGATRFGANVSSLGLRLMIGAAAAAAATMTSAFLWIAGGLTLAAAVQWWASGKLGAGLLAGIIALPLTTSPKPVSLASPVHGLPGRLIVFEGLDGSGKSTQLERLKDKLEGQGLEVVVTSWNSSDMLSEAVKKAKREQTLTPRTFALLNAADFADRVEKIIKPALERGAVVLADRWFYTGLARDSVRGNDPRWLRSLYKDALKPDAAYFFDLPVDTAIDRVLQRAQGRLGLSEDFDEPEGRRVLGQNAYAVGRDMRFHPDDRANFREFQARVIASYKAQASEFGLTTVDATGNRDEQTANLLPRVMKALGPLASLRKGSRRAAANVFDKDPAGDADALKRNYLHEKKGAHFYFRNALLPMQVHFAQLLAHVGMPQVLLHGSPHVDNYAKSAQGAAMVDFDRSRVGPYAWDLVRLLVSVSLRRKKQGDELLDKDASKQLLKGYLRGFHHPDRPFSEMRKLKNVEPEDDEKSTTAYLAANKKWAKEMRDNPLPISEPEVQELLRSYTPGQEWLKDYYVAEAGRGHGSMGLRGIYLVALRPRNPKAGLDAVLLNFKQTRTDPDTEWYKSPYATEHERMAAAAELYAPGWESRLGGARLQGVEYQARAIPPLNAKLKKMLNLDEQKDILYSVGTQLGRAHRLSVKGDPEALEKHLADHWQEILAAGETIRDEIVTAHKRYLRRMKADGQEPTDGRGDDE